MLTPGLTASRMLRSSGCHPEREGRRRNPKFGRIFGLQYVLRMRVASQPCRTANVRRRASSMFMQRGGLDMTVLRILRLTLLAVLAIGIVASTPAAAQKKPNVVMLMTDDTGWNDFGAYTGGGAALGHPTPNIDRIAKEGAVFTSWYGQASC